MRTSQWAPLLLLIFCGACSSRHDASGTAQLSPDRASAVQNDVRAFAATVAHDVTQEGPIAWRKHFADTPDFFMVSDGVLVFPTSAAATTGIQDFARTIDHMELKWGDDLRVDPLTPELAIMGAPWHEIRVDKAGKTVDQSGYFTALAEYRNGRWQFRDAHWSVAPLAPAH
jgi:hypothetical protein